MCRSKINVLLGNPELDWQSRVVAVEVERRLSGWTVQTDITLMGGWSSGSGQDCGQPRADAVPPANSHQRDAEAGRRHAARRRSYPSQNHGEVLKRPDRIKSHLVGRKNASQGGWRQGFGRSGGIYSYSSAVNHGSRVRCAIIPVIARLLLAEIAPEIPPLETRAMTAASDPQIVPRPPAAAPALCAADQGVADALTSVLSDNTRRVYGAQWRLFESWCGDVDLRSMPAEPLTVARYLAVRAGSGAGIATLRLASSAIAKVHEWAGHESPGREVVSRQVV